MLIKIRLLIFLVLSGYRLGCKYSIISQISIYYWTQNCISRYLWYCIFIFLRSHYSLLLQVRWFVAWWVDSIIISSDSKLTQNIIRKTTKLGQKELDQYGIPTHSRFNGTLRIWLVLLGNLWSLTWDGSARKKHLTINNIKLIFLNKTSSMLYPIKIYFQEP